MRRGEGLTTTACPRLARGQGLLGIEIDSFVQRTNLKQKLRMGGRDNSASESVQ